MTSLTTIFQTHYARLLHFAWKITGDRVRAEDVVMYAFRKLWEHRDAVPDKSVKAFLMITTKNNAYNSNLKTKQWRRKYDGYSQIVETAEYPDMDLKWGIVNALHHEINQLPPQRMKIVKLRMEGYTNVQIARMLGITRLTVRNQMVQAYKTLRVRLEGVEINY